MTIKETVDDLYIIIVNYDRLHILKVHEMDYFDGTIGSMFIYDHNHERPLSFMYILKDSFSDTTRQPDMEDSNNFHYFLSTMSL